MHIRKIRLITQKFALVTVRIITKSYNGRYEEESQDVSS